MFIIVVPDITDRSALKLLECTLCLRTIRSAFSTIRFFTLYIVRYATSLQDTVESSAAWHNSIACFQPPTAQVEQV